MKKVFVLFVAFVILSSVPFQPARAQSSAKLKAFLIVSGYGTALGALLGVASLAFDAKSRAIAQGASLGLYAGMIFGTYVITSAGRKNELPPGSYQDSITPYSEDVTPPDNEPYSDNSGGGFFDTPQRSQTSVVSFQDDMGQFKTKTARNSVPLYFELMRISF
ncbi:MAG: hypothetical protein JNM93_05560 [Bacteriovoracaceae bacterium]|nr:hypothetical protein [Bacteriovoracaceae bacterium]